MLKKITAAFLITIAVFVLHAQTDQYLFARFRIAASGGYALRLGKKPGTDPYFREISRGASFNTDATYYFRDNIGFGLKYSYFSTAGSSYRASPSVISNIDIQYLGPLFQTRISGNSERIALVSGVSFGYMNYRDKGWIDREYGTLKGGPIAALLELGVDARLFGNLFLGINTSVYGGSLSSVSRQGQTIKLDDKNRESLSRVEASAGLRYAFR